ncbi:MULTISPECIES: putative cell wall binding protein [unclassified Clostridium]|uniref:putative cell wall binding protein n=1 Tax=unclassified Clostridium TaxID=2614128 RepID=UPI000298342E|nr:MULTISPECIES: putative cell wall binding protein [unclassified Clostridium]EKQ53037.1 MAG: putative cell wall binding protein [Clostridium sp. Maddingley MBC34-26]
MYYFYSDGEMATGWQQDSDNIWHYFYGDGNGSMAHDTTIGGYHIDKSGKMITGRGWVPSDGSWYYLKGDGEVATDWLWNQGYWYYLYPEGSMAHDTTIKGYYLNDDGEWVPDFEPNGECIGDSISNKVTDGAAVTVTYDESEVLEDDSESIFDKAKSAAKDFTIGAAYSVDNNMFYGVTTHAVGIDEDALPDSTACKVGKVDGDAASIVGGSLETTAGAGIEGGGIVADGTAMALAPGLVLNAAGAAVITNGAVTVDRSLGNLVNDTMSLMSRPPNLSPKGAGRNGAFREAKSNSGMPVTEQPKKVTLAVDKRGNRIPGTDYDFGDGKVIRDHSGGHEFPDDPS